MEDAAILVVEDDEELKLLLQKGLLDYGFLSDAVENGDELQKNWTKKFTT